MMNKQRGSTLMVALVMLVLLTLIALSSMNATTTSIQVVGNAQFREEASAAAQQAIEGVISSNFTILPASSVVPADMNNDGTADANVEVAVPTCISSIPQRNVDVTDPDCLSSGKAQNTGIIGASGVVSTAQSWCFTQIWEVNATVNDSTTGANASVAQGVSMEVPAGTICD